MDEYDKDTVQAILVDSIQREMVRRYGRSPQEQREFDEQLKRLAIAADFEQGDHLPDGTVIGAAITGTVVVTAQPMLLNAEGLVRWLDEVMIKVHE